MTGEMMSLCSGFLMLVFFRRSEIGLRCVLRHICVCEREEGNM